MGKGKGKSKSKSKSKTDIEIDFELAMQKGLEKGHPEGPCQQQRQSEEHQQATHIIVIGPYITKIRIEAENE
eukprot:11058649-Karenia_brevis.AAC.1